jgi:hypothetical protein
MDLHGILHNEKKNTCLIPIYGPDHAVRGCAIQTLQTTSFIATVAAQYFVNIEV